MSAGDAASARVRAALNRAEDDAARSPWSAPADGVERRAQFAMGDPQAPLDQVFAVLDAHGLLDDHGRLRADVALVSMGDHFDWGGRDDRARAARDGLALVAWLAAHPADQVVMLAGNHDLARVGELAAFDDARFAEAQVEADAGYFGGIPEAERDALERAFCARYDLPSFEIAARDLSGFVEAQRPWVAHLLCEGRLVAAYAAGERVLFTHAGVTTRELALLGLGERARAPQIADVLSAKLVDAARAAVAAASGSPGARVELPGLHEAGSAAGEARGMFLHRASLEAGARLDAAREALSRRFDPRLLPRGLVQGIGHVADAKSRKLLGGTALVGLDPLERANGRLRTLVVSGGREIADARVTYELGVPDLARRVAHALGDAEDDAAVLLHLDGGMRETPAENYELLDVAALVAIRAAPTTS